jgi:predicted CoA-binding protein
MTENKPTLVIGASENPERYSNIAIKMLRDYKHDVIAVGNKSGKVRDVPINLDMPTENVHTVTLYVSAKNQNDFIAPLLALKPERVIFNPGTENPEFQAELSAHGIEPIEACTLVMLRTGQY